MNILCVVTDAFGSGGGIAQASRDMIEGFAKLPTLGKAFVLPLYGPRSPMGLPDRVVQIPGCANRPLFVLRTAYYALRARPALIFCNHLHLAPLACFLSMAVGAKLVIQLHGIEIWQKPTRLRRWALERAALLLCVSRDTRRRVNMACDVMPERLFVLANTVQARFHPGDRAAARERFGIHSSQLAVLTVARLAKDERYKGHNRVISILPKLWRRGLDVIYLIAGTGDDSDHLRRQAEVHGVADRVRFLGYVTDEDLPDLYRAADLFALPSRGEGFGIAFLEAMACGTPAIGLNVGGASDALVDGELGICVSSEAFDEALLYVLTRPPLSPDCLAEAVNVRFGFPIFFRRLDQILARLMLTTN